jgi:hypothetical protein
MSGASRHLFADTTSKGYSMTKTTKDDMPKLEAMVDRHGLYSVLAMLSDICGEKAEHLRSNWQDRSSAQNWGKAIAAIDVAASKVDNIQL